MTDNNCERYLEDPESHAEHIEQCESCRLLYATLDEPVRHHPVRLDAIPLAPWEGASHRAWSLVAGGAIGVAVLAVALFAFAGQSPMAQIARAMTASMPFGVLISTLRMFGGALRNAPAPLQIAIGVGFVAVNAVLYALLRRAPKGIDA